MFLKDEFGNSAFVDAEQLDRVKLFVDSEGQNKVMGSVHLTHQVEKIVFQVAFPSFPAIVKVAGVVDGVEIGDKPLSIKVTV